MGCPCYLCLKWWLPCLVARARLYQPRNPYWRGRLSTIDLLVLISLDQLLFNRSSYLNEEVNCIKPSPSVSVPCINSQLMCYIWGPASNLSIEIKGITRCKLTIISNQPFVRNSLDWFGPSQPVYWFLIVIHYNAVLLFKCSCFCFIIDLKEYSFHSYGLY